MDMSQCFQRTVVKGFLVLLSFRLVVSASCGRNLTNLPGRPGGRCCELVKHCCRDYSSPSWLNSPGAQADCALEPPSKINLTQAGDGMTIAWTPPQVSAERILGYQINLECRWTAENRQKHKSECFEIDGKNNTIVKLSPTIYTDRPAPSQHCHHSSIYSEFYGNAGEDDEASCNISVSSIPPFSKRTTERFAFKSCRELGCPTYEFPYRHLCYSEQEQTKGKSLLCQCKIRPLTKGELGTARNRSNPNSVYLQWSDRRDEHFQTAKYEINFETPTPGKRLSKAIPACGKDPCTVNFPENIEGLIKVTISTFPKSSRPGFEAYRYTSFSTPYIVEALCQLPSLLNGGVIGVRERTKHKGWFPAAHFECTEGYRLSNQTAEPFDCHFVNGIAEFKDQPTCDDIDECHIRDPQHNCVAPAECKNTNGSFECQCGFGYTGNGTYCTTITTMATSVHSTDASSPGSSSFIIKALIVILSLAALSVAFGVFFIARRLKYSKTASLQGHAEKAVTAIDKERRNSYDSMQCDVEVPCEKVPFPPSELCMRLPMKIPDAQYRMTGVYISYARSSELNKRRVRSLAHQLHKTYNFDVCVADPEFTLGDPTYCECIPMWIERNMARCRYILVVVSEFYPHCYREYAQYEPKESDSLEKTAVQAPPSVECSSQPDDDMSSQLNRRIQELAAKIDQQKKADEELRGAALAGARMSIEKLCENDSLAAFECLMLDCIKMKSPARLGNVIPVYLDWQALEVLLPLYLEASRRYFVNVAGRIGTYPPGMGDLTGNLPDLVARLLGQ